MEYKLMSVIALVVGLYAIIASVLNFEFFFNNKKAQRMVNVFGRKGARIFYGILGLLLILCAGYIYLA